MNLYLVYIHLFKGSLKKLEILNVFVLQIGFEFHLFHHDGSYNLNK